MLKKFKIPILASLFIMILFVGKSVATLNMIEQDDTLKTIFGIMKFEEKIKKRFITGETLPNSIIYEYAIYSAEGNPIYSNLKTEPSSLKFVTMNENGRLFYKNFFFVSEVPFFVVISQEISNKRNLFLVFLMLTFTFIMVAFVLYLSYLASVKPYKDAQKYMNHFFNDAMHELKTPLGIAGINLEMLGIENKHTNRIKNALKQMSITYDDVEYYIKRGYINFPNETINLGMYIRKRTNFLLSIADAKNIKVVFKFSDETMNVEMSELALQRVVDNTIINAIKYSPKDSKIIVSVQKEQENIGVFSIEDFGCGIKDIKRIFRRYEREDLAQGGFGLGLNIVHEICKKYLIEYDVKTQLNVGSTFFYRFTLVK